MTTYEAPLAQRVSDSFAQLTSAAKELNSISDELGKPISEIDIALKKLNLGVSVWVPIGKDDGSPNESWYWSEDIGYSKVGANWGICLRKVAGDHQQPDYDHEESWLFNDAPRTLRISAIEKIPDLLEKLSNEAARTTENIRARLSDAQAVANAVKGAANSTRVPLRIPASPPREQEGASVRPSDRLNVDALRAAIVSALAAAGHSAAAQLLGSGEWQADATSVRVTVPGMGKKMLSLVVNAAAEKIVLQELRRLGAPTRFLAVSAAAATPTEANPASNTAPEVEK
jgi:hypothetical protein